MKPEDEIAALIRLAGRRPGVPEEVAARVRAATHEHWREGLRRRARARFLWTGAALAAAALVILAIAFRVDTSTPPVPRELVRIELRRGPVWIRDSRAEVETGKGGRVAVRLPSGHSVRLDSDSKLRVLGRTALSLDRGTVYVDSGARARAPEPLLLRTPWGVVRETGTQYEVRVRRESLRIRVREGVVVLRAVDGVTHGVGAAQELEMDGRSVSGSREIATHGPEWGWVASLAPMPSLEGLSARAFLETIAREGGWRLEFADEETARLAAETTLQGSVEGLSPEQALEAVLPTCGMFHRILFGRLIVDRLRN
jgi:ferric-dicitrate binding protein FerR (iron transport regulator)